MKNLKILSVSLVIISSLFLGVSLVSAQTLTAEQIIQALLANPTLLQQVVNMLSQGRTGTVPPTAWCHDFNQNLQIGNSGSEVSALTTALNRDGVLGGEGAGQASFDERIAAAVVGFQEKYRSEILTPNGLANGTGFVGPSTRAKLNSLYGCNNFPPPPPLPNYAISVISPNGGETLVKGTDSLIKWSLNQINGPFDIRLLPYSPPCIVGRPCATSRLYTIATNVFSGPNKDVEAFTWGIGKVQELPGEYVIDGSYLIQICQSDTKNCDQSDSYFKISSGQTGNLPPVISGVSGPTILNIGQTGTWTVKASDPENGPLFYEVVWGDEPEVTDQSIYGRTPSIVAVSQTSTFTHIYNNTGIYTPIFKVTDNSNQSAKTSISVQIGAIPPSPPNQPAPTVSITSPQPNNTLTPGSVATISWQATGSGYDRYQIVVGNTVMNTERQLYDRVSMVDFIPAYQTSFPWNVPDLLNDFAKGSSYSFDQIKGSFYLQVKLVKDDRVGGSYVGSSGKVNFAVPFAGAITAPLITVLSPNGGETLTAGQTYMINWTDTGFVPGEGFQLFYHVNGSEPYWTLINCGEGARLHTATSCTWTLPNRPGLAGIFIGGGSGGQWKATASSQAFTITVPEAVKTSTTVGLGNSSSQTAATLEALKQLLNSIQQSLQ